eukprot:scaffold1006_cov270-Pinguiococcus_pyrenoidosus.AAC.20
MAISAQTPTSTLASHSGAVREEGLRQEVSLRRRDGALVGRQTQLRELEKLPARLLPHSVATGVRALQDLAASGLGELCGDLVRDPQDALTAALEEFLHDAHVSPTSSIVRERSGRG